MNKDYRRALIEAVYVDVNPLPGYVADDPLAKDAANVIGRLRVEVKQLGELVDNAQDHWRKHMKESKRRGEMLRRAKPFLRQLGMKELPDEIEALTDED